MQIYDNILIHITKNQTVKQQAYIQNYANKKASQQRGLANIFRNFSNYFLTTLVVTVLPFSVDLTT